MNDDMALVREYAASQSEQAFGEESDVATFTRRGLRQSAKLTVVAREPRIEVRWNDITVLKTNDSTFASGFVGVRVYGDPGKPSGATFSNLTFY